MENKLLFRTDVKPIQKICKFDAKEGFETHGMIILRPYKDTLNKVPNTTFRTVYVQEEDTYYGLPAALSADGTYKFKKITLNGIRHYDLSNIQDAKEWHIVKRHPCIMGSPRQLPVPTFYVENVELKATKAIDLAKKSVNAIDIVINKLDGSTIMDWGYIFGFDPKHNSQNIIQQALLEIAQTKPEKIVNYFAEKQLAQATIAFKKALSTNLITFALDKGFVWKDGVPLGYKEDAAIAHILENIDLLKMIVNEANDKIETINTGSEKKSKKKTEENFG